MPRPVLTELDGVAIVSTDEIADLAITTGKIGNLAVTTTKIADLGVTEAKLAADAVTTAKIANSQVTEAKLANNSVTSAKVVNGTLVSADFSSASPAWAQATLTSGFSTSPQGFRYCRFGKLLIVNMGVTRTGSSADSVVVTTLPSGFRPAYNVRVPLEITATDLGWTAFINTTGTVVLGRVWNGEAHTIAAVVEAA